MIFPKASLTLVPPDQNVGKRGRSTDLHKPGDPNYQYEKLKMEI
jgi:hypothetical protein